MTKAPAVFMHCIGTLLLFIVFGSGECMAQVGEAGTTAPLSTVMTTTTESLTTPTQPRVRRRDRTAARTDSRSTFSVTSDMTPEDIERYHRMLSAAKADDFRETVTTAPTVYKDLLVSAALVLPKHIADVTSETQLRFVGTTETLSGPLGSQPRGALTGRIVYCSAGHGWTNDNTSTTLWYTQRPITFGIVEDFGNLDQMNLYADHVWRAGATVVPLRPLGHQPIERIIDNNSENHTVYHGAWYDSDSTISFTMMRLDEVPYRFAMASTQETAVARFQPTLPKADVYPVYCWARDGADRVNQLYRVYHAGGADEVRVDHRRVGKGWVYLGQYFFNEGDRGYVEVSNLVDDPALEAGKHVVIADAIRFGNGLGDVNRGGGISTRPREEEASRYWVERALADGVEPFYMATDDTDQKTNVGCPPRMAAHMNREVDGDYFDRVFLSFHSNAAGGRGAVGLFEQNAELRPDHQVEWAEGTTNCLNEELTSGGLKLPYPWVIRAKLTDSHINFGEIRRDYINNEMVATITEVAFHDNALDAGLLRLPSVRLATARAMLRATLKYFGSAPTNPPPYGLPPERPQIMSAVSDAEGTITVTWAASPVHVLDGVQPEAYRICHSTDGFSFDGGVTTTALTVSFDGLTTETPHYFRVNAVSAGGESEPSMVAGAFHAGRTDRILLVPGFTSLSEDMNLTQTLEANVWAPLYPGGDIIRIIPNVMNPGGQAALAGSAVAASHCGFDTVIADSLSSVGLDLSRYRSLFLMLGRQPATELQVLSTLREPLQRFVRDGGNLCASGMNLAEAAAGTSASTQMRRFASDILHIGHAGKTTQTLNVAGVKGDLFSTASWTIQPVRGGIEFAVPPPDLLKPTRGGMPLLTFAQTKNPPAVVRAETGRAKIVTFGFPVEAIGGADVRNDCVKKLLEHFGHTTKPPVQARPPADSAQRGRAAGRQRSSRTRRR